MINLAKLKKLLIAIAIVGFGTTSYAQMTIGARLGINMNNLHGSSANNNKMLIGYNIGGLANYEMGDLIDGKFGDMFSLQGEFTIQTKGTKYKVGDISMNNSFTYVQVPVLGRVNYPVNDKITAFGEAGFFMAALFGVTLDGEKSWDHDLNPQTDKRKYREEFTGFDFGFVIGAGASMPIPNTKIKGFANLRYSLGLSNICEFTKSEYFVEGQDALKTGAFSILVGATYPIN
jgi:hypothetical protein